MRLLVLVCFAGLTFVASLPNKPSPAHEEISFTEEELVHAMLNKRGAADDLMGSMGGAVAKQMIKKVLDMPMLKKFLNKEFLEQFLNSDVSAAAGIVNEENINLIINSDLAKGLLTHEMFKVVIDSKAAKTLLAKETFERFMENPVIKKFLSPDTIDMIFNSDLIVNLIDPELFKSILDSEIVKKIAKSELATNNPIYNTRAFKALFNYQFIHYFVYSEAAKSFLSPSLVLGVLNADGPSGMLTAANVKDLLDSPLVMQLSDPGFILAMVDSVVVKALATPEFIHVVIYSDVVTKVGNADLWGKILNTGTVKGVCTPAVFADIAGAPAFKSLTSPQYINTYASSDLNKNAMKNKDIRAAVDAFYKAASSAA